MGDKNKAIGAEDLPETNSGKEDEKRKQTISELPPTRIVDDKLIGDDRDLQDALEKREPGDRDPACENNY